MASTAARQERCVSEISNGAVYLESALRNINSWSIWQSYWGRSFDIGIVKVVTLTTQGQVWLCMIQHNTNSIEQEASRWQSHGITSHGITILPYSGKITKPSDSMTP
ncbi:hypothetical protein THRCLA_08629 [Thraustotheca clavata]|uniref:Uncharacterized protein n=1 Tax=Thraustotheca clavata TaxID=74557 RepID=A0A1V9Z459_9STRA|nr:hypothetical protein THRCLA_08629 [Thraustotheca clavata]